MSKSNDRLAGQDIYCVVCLMTDNAVRARTIVNGHALCADHGKAAVRLATTDRFLHDVVNVTADMRAKEQNDGPYCVKCGHGPHAAYKCLMSHGNGQCECGYQHVMFKEAI